VIQSIINPQLLLLLDFVVCTFALVVVGNFRNLKRFILRELKGEVENAGQV